ncbi:uncharacterized protein LOC127865523 [Dreissena polymorpha]|uniref:uncharacterized protein LOC127865523 n=1 Tax=Dreissena polymorpha TaxID=45954 RepID=UPI0022656DCF|nr:uncharacterized protein LOC127865523 [Dreissena polymorpha]
MLVCRQDSDCHCGNDKFQAKCHQSENQQSLCSSCHPVHCDHSPCLSTQICVAEKYNTYTYYSCRDHCYDDCSVGTTCVKNYTSHSHCIDPCLPSPCSTRKTCIKRNSSPFYSCEEASHTTQPTSKPTDPPTTKTSTSRTTLQSTTEEASTASPAPTPAPPQSDCSEFNITLHGCRDSSACLLPHLLEVLCPDPQQAKYCPTKCGCCQPTFIG